MIPSTVYVVSYQNIRVNLISQDSADASEEYEPVDVNFD